MSNNPNNIAKLQEQFDDISTLLQDDMPIEDGSLVKALLVFAFIGRVDSLTGKFAEDCEAFYNKNKDRLSDGPLDKGLRDIVGGLPFYNVSGYNIRKILESSVSIEVSLRTYLNCFCKNLQDLFQKSSFADTITKLFSNTGILVVVLSFVLASEPLMASLSNEQFVNFVYNMVAKRFQTSKRFGGYLSTELLCNLIANCITENNEEMESTPDSISDPFCGMGRLLLTCGYHIGSENSKLPLFGNDINISSALVTRAMMLFSGFDNVSTEHNDFLEYHDNEKKYKYVVTQFPLNYMMSKEVPIVTHANHSFYFNFTKNATFLFVEQIISIMDERGAKSAFLTSGSSLLNNQDSGYRLSLFQRDLIETIISLPGKDFFGYTSIPVYLWILNNKKPSNLQGKVQLIDGIHLLDKKSTNKVEEVMSVYRYLKDSKYSKIISNEDFSSYSVDVLVGKRKQNLVVSSSQELKKQIDNIESAHRGREVKIDNSSIVQKCTINFGKYFDYRKEPINLDSEIESLSKLTMELVSLKDSIISIESNPAQEIVSRQEELKLPLSSIATEEMGKATTPSTEKEGMIYLTVPYLKGKDKYGTWVSPNNKSRLCTTSDTLIVCKANSSGEVFEGVDGVVSPFLCVVSPNRELVSPRYLYYLLKSEEESLKNMAKGAAIKNISLQCLRTTLFAIPPLHKQHEIENFLDEKIKKIDIVIKMLGSSDTSISRLRQALIESAVKGKINF